MASFTLPLLGLLAGFVSISSPCALPLIPGYLSYISSLPVSQLSGRQGRLVTLRASLLFVGGFTAVFTLLGIGVTLIGSIQLVDLPIVVRVFGVLIIALGLSNLGLFRLPFLMRERRVDLARVPRGPAWAFPLGMAFAAGWTPCIGPVLATILTAAAATRTVAWGGVLLVFYSLGLGIPFVLLGLGFSRGRRSVDWLRRHGRAIEVGGGLLLVGVGILFVSGAWQPLFRPLQRSFAQLGWPPI